LKRDVVVLGGGVAGLSIAWQLARRGRRPLVVSSSRPPTSLAAAGMLAPMPEANSARGLAAIAVDSLRQYPRLVADLGRDSERDVGFRRIGLVRLAYDDEAAAALREEVGAYEAAGMPSRWLEARACAREVEGVGTDGLVGGLLSFEEGDVHPGWFLAALAGAVTRLGGEHAREEVLGLRAVAGGVEVELAGGSVSAMQCVVALGSWTALLPGYEELVAPVKGQLLAFPDAQGPSRILYLGQNYVLGKPDGTVLVGGTVEHAGFSLDADANGENLRAVLARIWPRLVGAPAVARVGLRPMARDGLPVTGPLHDGGAVYVFTAHYRNGFLLAPRAAELMAAEMDGERAAAILAPFRPGRLLRVPGKGTASSRPSARSSR
jgi:glycine oxidase